MIRISRPLPQPFWLKIPMPSKRERVLRSSGPRHAPRLPPLTTQAIAAPISEPRRCRTLAPRSAPCSKPTAVKKRGLTPRTEAATLARSNSATNGRMRALAPKGVKDLVLPGARVASADLEKAISLHADAFLEKGIVVGAAADSTDSEGDDLVNAATKKNRQRLAALDGQDAWRSRTAAEPSGRLFP